MRGFTWTERPSPRDIRAPAGGDLWCLRNVFCQLMGWPHGSEDWQAFIEAPEGKDTYRLIDHLGLERFDPLCHQSELEVRLDHPGVLLFDLSIPSPVGHMGHMIYEPHLRDCRGLPPEYASYRPELVNVIIDTRQYPHHPHRQGCGSRW